MFASSSSATSGTNLGLARKLLGKTLSDVVGGATHDLLTRTLRQEIVLCWTAKQLDARRDVEGIRNEVHATVAALETHYAANPPTVTCHDPGTIALATSALERGTAYRAILNRLVEVTIAVHEEQEHVSISQVGAGRKRRQHGEDQVEQQRYVPAG